MKKGFLIYDKVDIQRNQYMINRLTEMFNNKKISLELKSVSKDDDLEKIAESWVGDCDFAINRSRYATISYILEKNNIRVFNKALITDICNDKFKTYKTLQGVVDFLPIKMGEEYIESGIDEKIEFPCVAKSLNGHGGSEVFLVNNLEEYQNIQGDYLLQKLSSNPGVDVRVYILDKKIVAAVKRTAKTGFKSNFSLGGKVEKYSLSDEEEKMVKSILDVFEIEYGGIDFIYHNDRPVFNEIEDAVGAKMLYQVSEIDIIKEYGDYLIKEIERQYA